MNHFSKKNIGVDYCCEKKSNCTVFPVVHCRFLTMKERISQTLCFMFILKSDILNQTLWDKAALLLRFFAFKFNKIIPIKLVSSGNKNFMLVRKNQKNLSVYFDYSKDMLNVTLHKKLQWFELVIDIDFITFNSIHKLSNILSFLIQKAKIDEETKQNTEPKLAYYKINDSFVLIIEKKIRNKN